MSLITDLTRMYLTHSTKPFIFTNDFDKVLPYDEGLSSAYMFIYHSVKVYVIFVPIVRLYMMKKQQMAI